MQQKRWLKIERGLLSVSTRWAEFILLKFIVIWQKPTESCETEMLGFVTTVQSDGFLMFCNSVCE
jgi:hypothetical protein